MSAGITDVYAELCLFLGETNQFGFATRWDCVHYCVGYYGGVTAVHLSAIAMLEQNGMIKP